MRVWRDVSENTKLTIVLIIMFILLCVVWFAFYRWLVDVTEVTINKIPIPGGG